MLSSIDILFIILFFGGTIFIGFLHKSKDLNDFAVGKRNFSNFSQVYTIVATWMSGNSWL